jgi:outer membrane immunogenic protein
MKRLALMLCGGVFAAAMATAALAADLPRPSYKAPVYSEPGFSWTGFYVGLNGGYGFGTSSWSEPISGGTTGNFNVRGPLAGGTIGYNMQTGAWVWGVEGDFDYSWIKGTGNGACIGGCETRLTWLATGRGRIGYAWDRWLPFITGGAAYGDIKMTPPPNGTSESKGKLGWTAGVGVEYAFLGNWSAKFEYLYVDLGTTTCGAASCGSDIDVKFKTNLARLGVNYRF